MQRAPNTEYTVPILISEQRLQWYFTFVIKCIHNESIDSKGELRLQSPRNYISDNNAGSLTGSPVITHDVTTGTGYWLVGFNWIIDFLN